METKQSISDVIRKLIIQIDRDYTLEELKTMCREKGLSVTGNKKLLACSLLRYELEKAQKQFE